VKVLGGYGWTKRHGDELALFDVPGFGPTVTSMDYTEQYYHGGLEYQKGRRLVKFDYRGSSFSEEKASTPDRKSMRLRIVGRSPLPMYDNLVVYGGYQHYEYRIEDNGDTLNANTGWAGGALYYGDGWNLRYSFIWDRARRTGDFSATDNLTNAVYLGKVWRRVGGVTVGYRNRMNDDVLSEIATDGYFFSGWLRARHNLTFRAGYGAETQDVSDGHTLTGAYERSRGYASVHYGFMANSEARVKFVNRCTEHDDIDSKYDYFRVGCDLIFNYPEYGSLIFSGAYLDGDYKNAESKFEFRDYMFSGDAWSREYRYFKAGVGGTYLRSRQDVDVEKFSVRLSGQYAFGPRESLEVIYTAYNFDDFADRSPIYSRYYTANVVELNLIYEL
jgi:hypothetical protein